MTRLSLVVPLVIIGANALPAAAGSGEAGHKHGTAFSAGEPGDREKPFRTIKVTMAESAGKMSFVPDHVEVRKGEQIKFVLYNSGALEHEFVLATAKENRKHAEAMKKNPDMQHQDPNAARVMPEKTDEIIWKFTKQGEFEFACLIPGHHEAGMFGTVEVK